MYVIFTYYEIPIQNQPFHVGIYTIVPWDDMVHTHTTPQKSNELIPKMKTAIFKQNGSLWGGEFSAKIFLKHWYLQCFLAMKALKPLF